MSYRNLLLLCLLLIIPVESALFSIPVFFILAVLTYIFYPQLLVVLLIFIGSAVLDILKMAPPGSSAIVILGVLVLVELLKGEVIFSDIKLVTAFLFIASFIYAKLFGYSDNILLFVILFGGAYALVSYFSKRSVWLK